VLYQEESLLMNHDSSMNNTKKISDKSIIINLFKTNITIAFIKNMLK